MRWLFRFLLLVAIVWAAGFLWFTTLIPVPGSTGDDVTDGIVILTGGKGRIEHGLSLYADGKARKLLVSGVGSGEDAGEFISMHAHQDDTPELQQQMAGIMLDRVADSTYSNAVETAKWAEKYRLKSLRIVTSEYHMPRSLKVLHQAMPDVQLLADPVATPELKRDWWQDVESLRILLREYHKFAFVSFMDLLI
jgi:uncharacterized SAM-binding protein YcdF (DUF218 family)